MIIPAGFAGFFIAMLTGMSIYIAIESLCPEDQWVSEMCIANYMESVEKIMFTFFSALAAVLVVLLPSLLAPRFKFYVAAIAFFTGCITAVFYMAFTADLWLPLVWSITAGILSFFWVFRKYGVTQRETQ